MSSNLEKAQAFMARCPGTTMMQADRYLGEAHGDVDVAVHTFNENMKKASAASSSPGPARPFSTNPDGPRMGTLASLDAKKKGNEYYVGGGDNSGQAVVAPKQVDGSDKKGGKDQQGDASAANPAGASYASNLFNAARQSGAALPNNGNGDNDDNDNAIGGNTDGNTVVPFSGAGRRLGHTEGPSPVIPAIVPNQRKVRVTFYKDGFVIDDSNDLRSMEDEAGKQFLDSISKGYIPQELATKYPNTTIDVKLVDQSHMEFDCPNMHVAFSGAGHKLGASGAPSTTRIGDTTSASLPGHSADIPTAFHFDENEEPKGKIVIHTPDNRRCEHKVNPNRHTVNDLRYLAAQDIPGLIPNRVDLVVRDMPPRKLTDFALTLAEAKCVNAVIMVRPYQ